ncbi:MAG: hypothetical protein L0H80_08055, partial [Propionibacterium sp.]|nr:hypothetical protein [Propionibacterium sp.]
MTTRGEGCDASFAGLVHRHREEDGGTVRSHLLAGLLMEIGQADLVGVGEDGGLDQTDLATVDLVDEGGAGCGKRFRAVLVGLPVAEERMTIQDQDDGLEIDEFQRARHQDGGVQTGPQPPFDDF